MHPFHTYHNHCLKYSADNFSTPKQLTHCYRLILNLAAFCCTGWYFNVCTAFADGSETQGVTFCRFTAESDAAAKEPHNSDRLSPASPLSESDTAFLD
ncbi:hypothetical protein M5U04_14895 [Xenorhabdus sp. XENO-1]|uniref:hypothetical protein n=1 Tax=Xenorhabdus bovienii TaxID=40576 RepID=UPI0020CA4707|nr:hypothetical protein [Xenorhabdus bovienii]MCP9269343.1 hypothetical protein [Xenorhabdus bovienii subsp. africana]